ncbi:Uncharacterised protein [Kingella potus]|uniref:Uncharacterized protein n=1 Tax=Kingella potus TaxID=265175 RepID=A0A377QZT4_9NEIS|nr:hypothetical protein [Kingella potus]UOP01626.1 hypothetical protein LVJ84_05570 [Kingella potus]STR00078.1 Uncharacterised protein [Kingella potus]
MGKYFIIGTILLTIQIKSYAEVTLIHGFIPIVYNLSKCGDEERMVHVQDKETWETIQKDNDKFLRDVLVFMHDNHGFDYLETVKNDPFKVVILLEEDAEVRLSRQNCANFLAANQKLIRKAIKHNLSHPEQPPIDVLSYFIDLEKQLYNNSFEWRRIQDDIVDDVLKDRPDIKNEIENRLYPKS